MIIEMYFLTDYQSCLNVTRRLVSYQILYLEFGLIYTKKKTEQVCIHATIMKPTV